MDNKDDNMTIKDFQTEFAKVYEELLTQIDCNDLDVFIHQNEDGKIIVNFDIR